jgi:diguanylate cyclase (GGDEF)-like protein
VRGKFPQQAADAEATEPEAPNIAGSPSERVLVNSLLAGLAQSKVGIALYDQHDRLQFANDEFRTAFAVEQGRYPTWEEIMRRSHAEHVGLMIKTDDIEAWLVDVRQRRRVLRQRSFECDLVDGGWYRMHETMTANDWMLCVANDITALKSNERVLRNARDLAIRTSQVDELTGCFNRRFIFAQLEDLLERQRPQTAPLSVAVLDLDHFKSINDTWGHQVGDEMLRHFSDQARANLRPQDWLGRTGGEEFLLLLPDTLPAQARRIIARLRTTLASAPLPVGTALVPCRFCAGIAQAGKGETLSDLYRRADQALYKAKQDGRNRDVLAAALAEAAAKSMNATKSTDRAS